MTPLHHMPLSYLPSPPVNGFHIGPLFIHFYGLMYVVGITLAVIITQRRVRGYGGDPGVVARRGHVGRARRASSAAGSTSTSPLPRRSRTSGTASSPSGRAASASGAAWPPAPWPGSGGCAGAGIAVAPFADAVAPALLVAQAIGRIGNYFNQELYGKRTGPALGPARSTAAPAPYQPTFLYELIWDLALAAILVWLGHHTAIRPPGLFALYVTGYSAFRIYEESLRIDYSQHFLGLRLNTFVASALTLIGIVWFTYTQRRRPTEPPALPADASAADIQADPSDLDAAPDTEAAAGSEADNGTAPAEAEAKTGTDEETGVARDTSGRRA